MLDVKGVWLAKLTFRSRFDWDAGFAGEAHVEAIEMLEARLEREDASAWTMALRAKLVRAMSFSRPQVMTPGP